MEMKFNFGCGPLVLKGVSRGGYATISVELKNGNDDIPLDIIENAAEKLYSAFHVSDVLLYEDDVLVCTIEKKRKGGE